MSNNTYIKCLTCNTQNVNCDYCKNCGSIINIILKRQLEREKIINLKKEEQKRKATGKSNQIIRRLTEHPNSIIRFLSNAVYSIFSFMALIIGIIIASLISLLHL